jgi:hypothetical protein
MNKGIIVLGMHRGGTSLTADVIRRWGAYEGENDLLLQGDSENPQGYWEYRPLIQLNEDLLSSVRAKWYTPPSDMEIEVLERFAQEPRYRDVALGLIEAMQKGGRPWFWKDPRLAVLLPFWKNIWTDVIYVIPIRHPLDIALSLRKRNAYPISASLLIWQRYMLGILKETEGLTNKIFVEYEQLIADPQVQSRRLQEFLSQQTGIDKQDSTVLGAMTAAINPELRHNRSSSDFDELQQATIEQKELYSFLKRKAENHIEAFDQTTFREYSGWREYLQTIDVMRRLWSALPPKERMIAMSQMSVSHKDYFGL